jgi:hypothetical protein
MSETDDETARIAPIPLTTRMNYLSWSIAAGVAGCGRCARAVSRASR